MTPPERGPVPELSFTRLHGWRVIADPPALDAMAADGDVLRISPDDAFVIGGQQPRLADEHAIVTPEHGFDAAHLTAEQVAAIAIEHIEWQLPAERPALAQGQIAMVPAKLVLRTDGSALLLVACAARRDLHDRLRG
jgi:hypothetical protein